MPLPMPRAPRPDDPAGSATAAPSWAADMAEADPSPLPAASGPATAQMPLFPASAAPRARHARLRAGLQSLLKVRAHRPAPAARAAGPDTLPSSSWPDSFFDPDAGREP